MHNSIRVMVAIGFVLVSLMSSGACAQGKKDKDEVKAVAGVIADGPWQVRIDTSATDRNIAGNFTVKKLEALKGGAFKATGEIEYGSNSGTFEGTLTGEFLDAKGKIGKKDVQLKIVFAHSGYEPLGLALGKWTDDGKTWRSIRLTRFALKPKREDVKPNDDFAKLLKGKVEFKTSYGIVPASGKLKLAFEKADKLGRLNISKDGKYVWGEKEYNFIPGATDKDNAKKHSGSTLVGNLMILKWKEPGSLLGKVDTEARILLYKDGKKVFGVGYLVKQEPFASDYFNLFDLEVKDDKK